MPSARQKADFAQAFADGLLMCMPKDGHGLARDFKWLGSHRYGIVHLGGRDRADLCQRAERASRLLGWPSPCLDQAPKHPTAAQRAEGPPSRLDTAGGLAD